jgi:ribosomal protein S18 acetylase RimI-like enzyme
MARVLLHQLDYVLDLRRKNSESLGFIPKPKMERYWELGQILVEEENGEPCGYLCFGNGRPTLKIYQACVQYDARRREHGLRLVARVIREALRRGCDSISLSCADDLEANDFWSSAGFQWAGQDRGGTKRGRLLNRWVMWLDAPQMRLGL